MAGHWIRIAKTAMTADMPPHIRACLHKLHARHNYGAPFEEEINEYEQALQLYREACDSIGIAATTFYLGERWLKSDQTNELGWCLLRESIQLTDAVDARMANTPRMTLAEYTQIAGRFDEAELLLQDTVENCRKTADYATLAETFYHLGHLRLEQFRFEAALPCFEEALTLARLIHDPMDEIYAWGHIAETIRLMGDAPRAVEINEQVMAFAREHVEPVLHDLPIVLLAKSLNDVGAQSRALSLIKELIQIFQQRRIRNPDWYIGVFDVLACVLSGQGDAQRAAQMHGVADCWLAAVKQRRWLHNDWEYAPYIAKARAALGNEAYEAAYAEGRAMTVEQAIACALSQDDLAKFT